MTIPLAADIESRLMRQASRLGLDAADYAERLIVEHLPAAKPVESLGDLFAEWDREDASNDPAELAGRNQELEELKQAMNTSRVEMEGPASRKPWP